MTEDDPLGAGAGPPADSDELLEASWTDRGRAVRGRELGLELLMTAGFGAAVFVLLALAPPAEAPHAIAWAVVVAYALAARADFPIGSGHVVPTQLFLVPLFALAPAALVPALVFLGLAIGLLGEVVFGRSRTDRLAYCGGDAMHALGPALVFVVLAGGDATTASAPIIVLAFAAQLAFDFLSSSLHDRLVFGTRPELHVKVLVQVWGFDAALAPIGLLAAEAAMHVPLAALGPLPLVVLLAVMAADRSRRIEHAHARLKALNRERRRREAAVQRLGDAFATNLDLDALLELVGRSATDALDGDAGRATEFSRSGPNLIRRSAVGAAAPTELHDAVEQRALAAAPEAASAEVEGQHAIAALIGDPSEPMGVVSVVRSTPFSGEERSLLVYLCGQAAVSAANVVHHELLREAEAQLRHQAFHDGLTELPNRALFADRVAHALARQARDDHDVAVLFIDLDGFKLVNDTLGHEAGDELLATTAQRISACLRQGDTAARLGGDEFAILLEALPDPGRALEVAGRLRIALAEPVQIREREFVVHASIGVAHREPGSDRESLLRQADLAMYAAKSRGGDRVEVFDPAMLTNADTRTELANDLRRAVTRGELELRYQPIVDLVDGRPVAVEALARWRHPRRGLLAPAAFIALAEQTGMIDEIGRCILDAACREAAAWPSDAGAMKVTVNVSSAQLRDGSFAADVAASLERHGLSPARLMLEVTESVAMATDLETQETLRELRRLGVGLALDDFGTGYSSLSYLARTKVDLLKLDRAFLANVDEDPVQARLVGAVIQLATSLGIEIVAEGIERSTQLNRVQELGGRLGQGFLLGRPVEAAALLAYLSGDEPAASQPALACAP
jgi:diguanylate cyclase (GGDEF)-like protein